VRISSSRSGKGILIALIALTMLTACNGPNGSARRGERTEVTSYFPRPQQQFVEQQYPALHVAIPQIPDAEFIEDDELCMVCHEAYTKAHQTNVHRGQSCEKCHGAGSRHVASRGLEPGSILSLKKLSPPERSEVCLKCHEQDACSEGARWRVSPHAHHGVACTDCHTQHYNVPPGTSPTQVADLESAPRNLLASYLQSQPPIDQESLREQSNNLGAVTPHVCYRCHAGMAHQEQIAHPHQIGGTTGFDCTTCHDPHGKVRQSSRTELCLQCHDRHAPTMAWHSSSHFLNSVGCTDCHNPHPSPFPQQVVDIFHTHIQRPPRTPMSVDEPGVCYKCHPGIYAKTSMPSHHPIKEGKMVCSNCHDPHGQTQDNLREPTINLVCYRCHADKQGPFAYEHPPVTENCDYCHEPHGTVANNLLRQPATFLCLRCHTGHRTGPTFGPHTGAGLVDVGANPNVQRAFYTDCTQCHSQIHGSDLPSPHLPHAFMR
jgi:DmsE family decaheme c-type cytochrome